MKPSPRSLLGRPFATSALAILVGATVAACAGAHRNATIPPAASSGSAAPVQATGVGATAYLKITVPGNVLTSGRGRKPRYVSPGTISLAVSAVPSPNPGNATPVVLATPNISGTSPYCTAVSSYGRTCNVPIPIPVSLTAPSTAALNLDVAAFSTAAPVTGGGLSFAANNPTTLLSEGTLSGVVVTQNVANLTLPIVLSGSVASVTVAGLDSSGTIPLPVANASATPTALTIPVSYTARDAAGNAILGAYLQPLTATLSNINNGLSLSGTIAGTPAPVGTPVWSLTLLSSADTLNVITTAKGVLRENLTFAVAGTPVNSPSPLAFRASDPSVYTDYDQYGNVPSGNAYSLGSGTIQPETLASDSSGTIYYTFEGSMTGVGTIAFATNGLSSTAQTSSQCSISASGPFLAMAPQVLQTGGYPTVYFVNASQIVVVVVFNGTSCATSTAALPFVTSETPTTMTIGYEGLVPEVWVGTSAGNFYAYNTMTGMFRNFPTGFNNTTTQNLVVDGGGSGAIAGLFPYVYGGTTNPTSATLPYQVGLTTQGIAFVDAVQGGLDFVGTATETGPVPSVALYREASPSPILKFPVGTNATVFQSPQTGNVAIASQNGVTEFTPNSAGSLSDNNPGSANWTQYGSSYGSASAFGPSAIVTGAEQGTAYWGFATNPSSYGQRGLIRYTNDQKTEQVFSGIPNIVVGDSNATGIALGGDGRIWVADRGNEALYAFPGYGAVGRTNVSGVIPNAFARKRASLRSPVAPRTTTLRKP